MTPNPLELQFGCTVPDLNRVFIHSLIQQVFNTKALWS